MIFTGYKIHPEELFNRGPMSSSVEKTTENKYDRVARSFYLLFLFSFLSTSRGSTLWLAEAYPMASAFMGFLPFPALESIERRSSLYNTL